MPTNKFDSPATGTPGSEGHQAETPVSSRRRQLIKASAAAVPAIMTLRSGAAAATSLNGCLERDADRAAIELGDADKVLGDDASETALDEWVRVEGRAGQRITVTGGNAAGVYDCIVKDDSSLAYYDSNGVFIDPNTPGNNGVLNQIKNGDAINFYCILKLGAWECVDEGGNLIDTTVPDTAVDAGKMVYLLVYVLSFNGHITGATYHPHPPRVLDQPADPITGSCLCSVDPNFNILG